MGPSLQHTDTEMQDNYSNDSRPQRRDPVGYQERTLWSHAEKRVHELLGRHTDQESMRHQQPSDDGRTRRRDPESFATIYNSFTANYHGQNDEGGDYSHPKPPSACISRGRRVQFSEQLEVETKTPIRVHMPTIPILKTGGSMKNHPTTPKSIYASPRHLLEPIRNESNQEIPANSRDPTPRAGSTPYKLPELANGRRNNDPNYSHKASLDPAPRAAKDPFNTPESRHVSQNILESLERMEKRSGGKSIDRSKTSTRHRRTDNKAVEGQSTSQFQPMGDRPSGDVNPTSFQRATRVDRYQFSDSTRVGSPSLLNDEPLKPYSSRSDRWDAEDLSPDSWRQSNDNKLQDDEDEDDDDDENQSTYLINKYTNNKKSKNMARKAPSANAKVTKKSNESPPKDRQVLSDETNFLTPQYKNVKESKREVNSEPWLKRGKRSATKSNGYTQLDDDTYASFVETQGTETVLLPGLPKHIDVGQIDDEAVEESRSVPYAKKRKGLGKFLTRRSKTSVIKPTSSDDDASKGVPFHRLPVVALSFEDESGELRQSTDDTDEASDSSLHLRTFKWNTFDNESESEAHTKDFLFASHRMEAKKRQRLVLMFVFLVVFCLAVGLPVYFTLLGEVEDQVEEVPEFSIETSDCATADIVTSPSTFSERYTTIRMYIESLEASDVVKIDDANTPERRALCWLSEFDERQVGVMKGDIPALVQRYTLGVIYFSLTDNNPEGADALLKLGFLSSDHECEWEPILCAIPRKATALLLSNQFLSGTLPSEVGNLLNLCKYTARATTKKLRNRVHFSHMSLLQLF